MNAINSPNGMPISIVSEYFIIITKKVTAHKPAKSTNPLMPSRYNTNTSDV